MLTAFGKLQNQINSLIGGSIYQGVWNASTNTPTLTSSVGTDGYYYIVNVAGSTNLNGITDWKIGDWAIFHGGTWQKVDNTDAVSSVNGFTGAVSLTTSNIPEGPTNFYYTDARSRSALSFTAGSGAYNSTTGVITIPTNTSQLTNGANYITLASLSGTAPIQYNNTTGAISITQSTDSSDGYLSSTDWTTFNNKLSSLSGAVLTTTNQNVGGIKTFTDLTDFSASGIRIGLQGWVTPNQVYSEGTGNFYVNLSGAGHTIIGNSGKNVGIGIISPATKFDVVDSSNTFAAKIQGSGGSNFVAIGTTGGVTNGVPSINAYTANFAATTNLSLQPNGGNVGIGTASPATKLYVKSTENANWTTTFENGSTNGHQVYTCYNNGTERYGIYISGGANNANSYDLLVGSNRLVVSGTGNVGIGTSNPSNTAGFQKQLQIEGAYPALTLNNTTDPGKWTLGAGGAGGLGIWNNTTNTYPLYIPSSNNILIGTTTDAGYKLDVNGTGRFSGSFGDLIRLEGTSTGNNTNYYSAKNGSGDVMQIGIANAGYTNGSYPAIVARGAYLYSPRDLGIIAENGYPILFQTGAAERMRITSGGNVGIGTPSPSFQLQLSNDSAAKPGSPLWTVSSDIRIKENVRPYTDGIDKLMQINPVYYDYNGKAGFSITKDNIGIIAQEMQEVLPNTIKTFNAKLNEEDEEETELLSFNANELIYVLINSVKELKAEIEILKQK